MDSSITNDLKEILHTVDHWLVPTVAAETSFPNSAKLRVLRNNLGDVLERIREVEGDGKAVAAVSASLEEVAERFASFMPAATFEREAITAMVGLFNDLAAHAWALEVGLRLASGGTLPDDLQTLAVARVLVKRGINTASLAFADRHGGVA